MARSELPTRDAEAMTTYLQGKALFRSYLRSGHGEELQQARDCFATAEARDPDFDIAKLYLAATQTELRDPDAAIPKLEDLVQRNRYAAEAHVHLAYAHIKRYRQADYSAAAEELVKATTAAKALKRSELIDLIEAYRVFLLAVRGGRGTDDASQKKSYLEEAVRAGKDLLKRAAAGDKVRGERQTEHANGEKTFWAQAREAVKKLLKRAKDLDKAPDEKMAIAFEANNAIGIAFLWLGEFSPFEPDSAFWTQSEQYLRAALALRPNSVRALQNMGLLLMVQGDRLHNDPIKARDFYERAKVFVQQSLRLNSFDQYPHFLMALVSARTDAWSEAKQSLESGKKQKGAVPQEKWAAIERAIQTRDRSLVLELR